MEETNDGIELYHISNNTYYPKENSQSISYGQN